MDNGNVTSGLSAAMVALCREANRVAADRETQLKRLREANDRARKLESSITSLLNVMDAEDLKDVEDEVGNTLRRLRGDVPENEPESEDVWRVMNQHPDAVWTAARVEEELIKLGYKPRSKAVYNVLSWLATKRQLERVGRGKYRVRDYGVGVEGLDFNEEA